MRHWRINLILLFTILIAATIASRLFFLQVIKNEYYGALAKGQQIIYSSWEGDRGEIFLKNQKLAVATTKNYSFVYLDPSEVALTDKEATAQSLSGILSLNKSTILSKLGHDSLYELLKKKLSDQEIEDLEAANLTGVHLGQEKMRSYPFAEFASHLLGFVNQEGQGQYGLEEYWQDTLSGKESFIESERGPWGYFSLSADDISQSKGSDLYLTIDYNIQYFAEKLLEKAKTNYEAIDGTIIVADPKTGKVLALASFPEFDPNNYTQEKDLGIFQSDAVEKVFEPGSVFKPLTMAAALDQNKITPQTTYIDEGLVKIGTYTIYNYGQRTYGENTMTQVLEKSINTGAVFAERQVGDANFLKYVEKFGVFEKTGIDLAGEIASANKELKNGREINYATASFGQGVELTPIQLVRVFSAIANGGKLVKPFVVEKIVNGEKVKVIEPEVSKEQIISSDTASKLTAMLVSVVENGYSKKAQVPGYYVAGKTGTAQISYAALGINQKGYSDHTYQSFIGFAPAFDPQFIILIKLNNPQTNTAEYSAIPLFQELAKYIIDYYQIAPDY
jgi:cell division protein FtsI (penicillin-binding protein 3)/stage V sporulation protein D (sporulation-specific penicillin-binding protein)